MRILYVVFVLFFISCTKEPLIDMTPLSITDNMLGETCLGNYVDHSIDSKRIVLPSYNSVDDIYRIVVDRKFIMYYNNEYVSDYDGVIHFKKFDDTLNYAHDVIFQVVHCDSFYFHGILFGKEKL